MSDIKLCCSIWARVYCQNAVQNVAQYAQSCIDAFYESYVPEYYVRTFNMEKNSIETRIRSKGSGRVDASVRISTTYMFNNYGDGKTFYVTGLVWKTGQHGPRTVGHILKPSPLNRLYQYYKSKKYERPAKDAANNEIKRVAYEIIRVR